VEELRIVAPEVVAPVGDEVVRPAAHLAEPGSRHELWPPLLGHVDAQPPSQLAHLPFEVSLEIVVVQQREIRGAGCGRPESPDVVHQFRQAGRRLIGRRWVVDPLPEPLDLGRRYLLWSVGL